LSEEKRWGLNLAYDKRFGAIAITPVNPEGEKTAQFMLRVSDVIRMSGITNFELAEYLKEAEAPLVPVRNIEDIRREAVERANVFGKIVLDVGGYGGEFAKMALDRGAKRAIVLDTEQWRHYGWPEIHLDGVEYVKGDLMDYVPDIESDMAQFHIPASQLRRMVPPFCFDHLPMPDVLLLYNILYHVKNPLAFLERAREVIAPDGEMLLCTLFRYHDGAWVYYYEPRECNPTDDSVFFGPSLGALERWLTTTGWSFEQVGRAFDRVVYRCKPVEPQGRESRA
jgi:SAM-dependent methyltransferase